MGKITPWAQFPLELEVIWYGPDLLQNKAKTAREKV